MTNELQLLTKKLILILVFGITLYAAWLLRDILAVLLIAGFFTIVVNPLIDLGERYKIPSWLTLIGIYILIFILGAIVVGTLIPIVIDYVKMTANFITNWVNTTQQIYMSEGIHGLHLHPYLEKVVVFVLGENNIEHIFDIIKQNAGSLQSFVTNQVGSLTNGGISIIGTVGGVVANWGLISVSTFLMVLERKKVGHFLLQLAPNKVDHYLKNHYHAIQDVTTAWIKATLTLSVSIFFATFVGLTLVKWIFGYDTNQTFTLALIGGIMEFIPYVGPLIALIPAAIIGLGISWKAALVIIALYLIIQRLENDILVPIVMSRALDLSPLLVFIVMLGGATLGGILGIILAVPIAGIARVIYTDYMRRRNEGIPHPIEEQFLQEKKLPRKKLIAKA